MHARKALALCPWCRSTSWNWLRLLPTVSVADLQGRVALDSGRALLLYVMYCTP